jgi:hypothetical protein
MPGLGLFLDAFSCPLFFDVLPQKDSFGTFSVTVSLPIVKIGTDSMTLVLLKQVRDFVSHQLSVDLSVDSFNCNVAVRALSSAFQVNLRASNAPPLTI